MSDGTGHRQGRLSEYWCCADLMLECGVLQRKKADLLTRQWIMMLTCSYVRWTQSLQCWGEKKSPAVLYLHLSLCFSVGRLRWSRRTRPTWRRRPSSTAKKQTHTCKTLKHPKKKSWKSQNNTLISHISCVCILGSKRRARRKGRSRTRWFFWAPRTKRTTRRWWS